MYIHMNYIFEIRKRYFNEFSKYMSSLHIGMDTSHKKIIVCSWYLIQMVTQNMLRTYAKKYIFSKEKQSDL